MRAMLAGSMILLAAGCGSVTGAMKQLPRMGNSLQRVEAHLSQTNGSLKRTVGHLGGMQQRLGNVEQAITATNQSIASMRARLARVDEGIERLGIQLGGDLKSVSHALAGTNRTLTGMRDGLNEMNGKLGATNSGLARMFGQLSTTNREIERVRKDVGAVGARVVGALDPFVDRKVDELISRYAPAVAVVIGVVCLVLIACGALFFRTLLRMNAALQQINHNVAPPRSGGPRDAPERAAGLPRAPTLAGAS